MRGPAYLSLALVLCLAGCGGASIEGEPAFGEAESRCWQPGEASGPWRPGCAARRNLAALADNPADLHLARREGPRDAMRRDAVIGGYAQSRAVQRAQSAPPSSQAISGASGAAR